MNGQMSNVGAVKLALDVVCGTDYERYVGIKAQAVELPDHVRETRKKVDEQNKQQQLSNS